ncbi:hypothetical protein K9B35_02780 [Sphingomonas sp. R647]|uniref:hypothetical protein n=1 Tax=Sphingomonas sp. R647 TaxID=2875233 RepID=UPI001CD1E226|nr:hypothetical protein [Sphingomonas sp. R647]MCA1196881.1 hypothetical protein [Sphingomonas sp. R647]
MAGTAQAQIASPIAAAEAEAQRNYEIAVAKAEAQRKYEIAVAEAEAERRKAIALARGGGAPGPVAAGVPPVDRAIAAPVASPVHATAPVQPMPAQAGPVPAPQAASGECDAAQRTAAGIVRRPNIYAQKCLKLQKLRDYAIAADGKYSAAGLNANLSIGSANDVAEVVGSYSLNKRVPWGDGPESYSFTRWQFRGGLLVPVDKSGGTTAAFADLTEVEAFKRVGGLLGVEWRWGGETKVADLNTKVAAMLTKARQDCEAAAKARDASSDGLTESPDGDLPNCRDANLNSWMAKDTPRANGYWAMVSDHLWGKKPTTERFLGVEGRIVPYQLKYLPLKDPGLTGDTLLTGSPFDNNGDLIQANFRELDRARYSVKLYAGGVEGDLGFGGSLTYRRIVDQPKGTKDAVLCPPSTANGALCAAQQIARPYESEGWVVGGRIAGKIQPVLFLPEMGMEMKVSYATDLNQIGFDAPLYLLADKEGKASGGLRLGCTGDGTTQAGYTIKGECKASVFIGTSFTLRGAP